MSSSGTSSCTVWMAAFFGATGVIAGSFAAHGLKESMDPSLLEVFKTGVFYQLIHSLALLSVGAWQEARGLRVRWVAGLWVFGISVFSGSLYVLAISGQRVWGAVTPWGGLGLILGWFALMANIRGKLT